MRMRKLGGTRKEPDSENIGSLRRGVRPFSGTVLYSIPVVQNCYNL